MYQIERESKLANVSGAIQYKPLVILLFPFPVLVIFSSKLCINFNLLSSDDNLQNLMHQ